MQNIAESYDKIRNFSLTEFDRTPVRELEKIWAELGSIKPQGDYGQYGELVMTITKPLMFLWGQTPAFDSVVREEMPLFNVRGFRNTRWEFSSWIDALKRLQNYLNNNTAVSTCFRKICTEKYGTDALVPYGQFFDLYYWTESKKDNRSKNENTSCEENNQTVAFDENRLQKELRNLVDLLDNLKNTGKISGTEWRDYRKRWSDYPQARDSIVGQLKHMQRSVR
jgi:hypothetical protein